MNKILTELKKIMTDSIKEYLPEVSFDRLEDNGTVFYMNGKNGTEFDWFVNDKISDFMMFYNDEDNMGAVKATLYNAGDVLIYVYGEQGKTIVKEINTFLDVEKEDILSLAVNLRYEADEKRIWDSDIESIDTDVEPEVDIIKDYLGRAYAYEDMRTRKRMLGQAAYVSKKIVDEGRKVGYMCREEALNENDSGWSFLAGDEEDEYIQDYNNIAIMSVHSVLQYDRTVMKYITCPEGTRLVRVSEDEFAPDED
jgi:hypothetical protein